MQKYVEWFPSNALLKKMWWSADREKNAFENQKIIIFHQKKNLCLILNCQYNVVVHFSMHIFSLKEYKSINGFLKYDIFFLRALNSVRDFKKKFVPTINIIHNTISFYNWQKYSSHIIHSYISSGDIITCVDNIN